MPRVNDQPWPEFKSVGPKRVIEGLPELLRAIADAQVAMTEQARRTSSNTAHYKVLLRTQEAMAAIVEVFLAGASMMKVST